MKPDVLLLRLSSGYRQNRGCPGLIASSNSGQPKNLGSLVGGGGGVACLTNLRLLKPTFHTASGRHYS
jgi:hypothetical protein